MVVPIDANERLSAARSSRDHKIAIEPREPRAPHSIAFICGALRLFIRQCNRFSFTQLRLVFYELLFVCLSIAGAPLLLPPPPFRCASVTYKQCVRRWIFGVCIYLLHVIYVWVCGEWKRCDPSRCSSTHKRCVAHVFICFIYLNLKSI